MKPTDRDWPLCACGCGEPVPVRKASVPGKGLKRGEPCKFVAGHSSRTKRKPIVDGRKQCSSCEMWKLIEDFSRNRKRACGLEPRCKQCFSEYHRRYNAENREKRTEAARRFRAKNPDYQRLNVARWREANYALHLERSQMYAAARRARVRDQFVEHIDRVVVFERDNGICGLCGMAVVGPFTIDHIIPISKGGPHSYENVQLAHPTCNFSKRDRLYVKDQEQAQGDRPVGL